MKFKRSLIFLLIWALLLAGCGSSKPSAGQPVETEAPQQPEAVEEPAPTEEPAQEPAAKRSSTLPYTYQVPGKQIYVDVPDSPYFGSEWGYSMLYANGDERGIAVTAIRSEDASGKTAQDVFPEVSSEYLHNMRSYCTAKEMRVDSEQALTVNGLEVYRYEGRILDEVSELYTVGYTFILDNTACSIQGAVFSSSQDPASVDEIRALIDEMITTVRTAE